MKHSNSSLQTFAQCALKWKFKYKDQLPDKSGPAADRGSTIHKQIELFFKANSDLPQEALHFGQFLTGLKSSAQCMPEISISVDKDWSLVEENSESAWMRGVLDLVVLSKDRVAVYDWKTGKIYDKHSEQAKLYGLLALAKYPEVAHVDIYFVYLDQKTSKPFIVHRKNSDSDRKFFEDKVSQVELAIQHDMFPAQPQFLCRYCAYSRANKGPCSF